MGLEEPNPLIGLLCILCQWDSTLPQLVALPLVAQLQRQRLPMKHPLRHDQRQRLPKSRVVFRQELVAK